MVAGRSIFRRLAGHISHLGTRAHSSSGLSGLGQLSGALIGRRGASAVFASVGGDLLVGLPHLENPPDDRSETAIGYHWAARGMTVAVEMIVPGVCGLWLDQKLGTKVVLTILGFALGLVGGIWHLIRMTQE